MADTKEDEVIEVKELLCRAICARSGIRADEPMGPGHGTKVAWHAFGLEAEADMAFFDAAGYEIKRKRKERPQYDVMGIMFDLKHRSSSQKEIARKFGCSKNTVQDINKGRTHADQTGATSEKPLRSWTHKGGRPTKGPVMTDHTTLQRGEAHG